VSTPNNIPGWPRDEQAVAWLRACLRAVRAGNTQMVELAQAELRRLGVDVRTVDKENRA
jgi:hypothetical protein